MTGLPSTPPEHTLRVSIRPILAQVDGLLAWGAREGRAFPWRTSAGYELAVAEILLQKTRGEAVVPVWEAVVSKYATAEDMAAASVDAVQEIVGPLGLGAQRARRLIGMAASWPPKDGPIAGLGSYGIGVLALANQTTEAAPVDGNIARVLTRYHGFSFERGEPRKKPEVRGRMGELIQACAPESRIGLVYAIVDLGALVCAPRRPKCTVCPLASGCAFAAGTSGAEVRRPCPEE